ncbi:MAG: 2-C-methyl-D-erythritol 2,4-cyclodiphosphate synthase [Acidobacteriota bacterium]|nr:2-C-methyl-D-erythritol 2,4-cyclodiphosphate synthase [Acidobacteriota bacterium]MDW3228377.1 2-C-methyl-D-erythritol 2,4-cyclodiphosphate synthase [Acidobacteriota bacterium]MDY0232213.1 2-C-methyl-D-erythritol 2,4-cyclodiphosphate synthase [Candidatus Saccharicenans sp.]
MKFKIGLGYDLHRLVPGRPLVVGGVNLPSEVGCLAHSDGDVLIHAIIDALLGAKGEGDIGQRFPDSDPAYAGRASLEFLASIMEEIKGAGFTVVNIDSLVLLEKPRLLPYIDSMKTNLYPLLGISPQNIGIKAKTGEGLGEIGAGRAIASWVVALLNSSG